MLTRTYIVAVLAITVFTAALGFLLWNSEEERIIDNDDYYCSGWCRGPQDAPVVIDSFTDFECNLCVEKEALATRAIELYEGQILQDFHHFPNSEFSYKIAEALEAAGDQGKFWELHYRLVTNTPDDLPSLYQIASEIELDMEKFNLALESGQYREKVEKAKEEAKATGIEYVGMFVNGKEYKGYPGNIENLARMIDKELHK
ncbi:MAG: thioredoxin domain-containing protein [Dehalococcoidia bacterium]